MFLRLCTPVSVPSPEAPIRFAANAGPTVPGDYAVREPERYDTLSTDSTAIQRHCQGHSPSDAKVTLRNVTMRPSQRQQGRTGPCRRAGHAFTASHSPSTGFCVLSIFKISICDFLIPVFPPGRGTRLSRFQGTEVCRGTPFAIRFEPSETCTGILACRGRSRS